MEVETEWKLMAEVSDFRDGVPQLPEWIEHWVRNHRYALLTDKQSLYELTFSLCAEHTGVSCF